MLQIRKNKCNGRQAIQSPIKVAHERTHPCLVQRRQTLAYVAAIVCISYGWCTDHNTRYIGLSNVCACYMPNKQAVQKRLHEQLKTFLEVMERQLNCIAFNVDYDVGKRHMDLFFISGIIGISWNLPYFYIYYRMQHFVPIRIQVLLFRIDPLSVKR